MLIQSLSEKRHLTDSNEHTFFDPIKSLQKNFFRTQQRSRIIN